MCRVTPRDPGLAERELYYFILGYISRPRAARHNWPIVAIADKNKNELFLSLLCTFYRQCAGGAQTESSLNLTKRVYTENIFVCVELYVLVINCAFEFKKKGG